VYYERYEENILPRGNILLSDDEILIPITYTHLPYDIKNPILQFWTFLVGGEKFLDLSNLAMKELVTGACKRHNICALNLSRNKLQYLSPRRFTRLKKLNIITLDYNQFTTFPSVLISLTTLTRLSLSHNAITRIPNEISQLKNLKILRVEFNRLQELPQTMSCLVQLEELALSGNQWKNTASIWTTLCSLPSLECLLLAQSQVSEIPTNISLLTKLKILDCSVNRITLLPDSLGMLKELQILRLGHNRIKQIPTGITKLQHLLHLELNNNEIESISLTLWNALSKRATLILEHNPLPLNFVRHRKVNLKSSAFSSLNDKHTTTQSHIIIHLSYISRHHVLLRQKVISDH
jgi:Leucine-rich repeat (LRR) protein